MATKKYYRFVYDFSAETQKAFSFEFSGGVTTSNNWHEWFPKSQCTFSDPNEVGNVFVNIPAWLFVSKSLDEHRCAARFIDEIEF